MALNAEEAEKTATHCREKEVLLQLGLCCRYMPETQAILSHVEAGALGEVYMARTDIIRQRGAPAGWFGNKEKSAGGPLIDIGVHMIDLAWYLMGRPKPIRAKALNFSNRIVDRHPKNVSVYSAYEMDDTYNVEDSSHGLITFEGGRGLMYQASWSMNAEDVDNRLELYGDKGGASFDPLHLIRDEASGMVKSHLFYAPSNCFATQAEHFALAVLGKEELLAPAEDGIAVQRMLDGLYRSAQSGLEVAL